MEKLLNILNSLFDKVYIPHIASADKQAHAWGGLIAFGAVWAISSAFIALAVVYTLAAGKEIYDRFHKDVHTCDIWDAVATVFIPTVIFAVKFGGGLVAVN